MATSTQIAEKAMEILKSNDNPTDQVIDRALDVVLIDLGIDPESGAGIFMFGVAKNVLFSRRGFAVVNTVSRRHKDAH